MEVIDFGMPTPDLVEKLKELRKYKLEIQNMDEKSQSLKEKVATLEAEVVIMMDNAGVSKMKVDGSTMYRKTDKYASIPTDTREAAFEWLKQHDLGALVKSQVNNRDLMAALKEIDPDELPDQSVEHPIIKISKVERIGLRK
jgi:hypothetical protein